MTNKRLSYLNELESLKVASHPGQSRGLIKIQKQLDFDLKPFGREVKHVTEPNRSRVAFVFLSPKLDDEAQNTMFMHKIRSVKVITDANSLNDIQS